MKWFGNRVDLLRARMLGGIYLVACWLMLLHYRDFDGQASIQFIRALFK